MKTWKLRLKVLEDIDASLSIATCSLSSKFLIEDEKNGIK